jgi:CBS domain-containing protein
MLDPPKKVQQISQLFAPSEVFFSPADLTETAIVRELMRRLERTGKLHDADGAFSILLDRKCCSIVRLASDIAVVHAKLKCVEQLCIAVALASVGIRCECLAPEVSEFRILVLILTPFDEPGGYIRVASTIRRMLAQPGVADNLRAAKDPDTVWRLFHASTVHLPEYATAGDIMRDQFKALRDTDALSVAIDAFCANNADELPVVDKDGDLVGVVGEAELLRICLPEYITWTEDLSAILDFEPFAEVLRREEAMPIVEIMLFSDRYAAVDAGTPAIQVAKIMMRNEVKQVWVTHGNRLVGVISLADFVRKVLRA